MKTIKIPNPDEGWAEVELYRWQHGELPPQTGECNPVSKPEALRAFVRLLNEGDMSKLPLPFNVAIVLSHIATQLELLELECNVDAGLIKYGDDKLQQNRDILNGDINALRDQLTAKDSEIAGLYKQLGSLTLDIQKLAGEKNQLTAELSRLKSELEKKGAI